MLRCSRPPAFWRLPPSPAGWICLERAPRSRESLPTGSFDLVLRGLCFRCCMLPPCAVCSQKWLEKMGHEPTVTAMRIEQVDGRSRLEEKLKSRQQRHGADEHILPKRQRTAAFECNLWITAVLSRLVLCFFVLVAGKAI